MTMEQLNAEASAYGMPTMQPYTGKTLSGDNPWGWDMSNDPYATTTPTPAPNSGSIGKPYEPIQPVSSQYGGFGGGWDMTNDPYASTYGPESSDYYGSYGA